MKYWEWDGEHLGLDFLTFLTENGDASNTQSIEGTCDCFHRYCCKVYVDGVQMESGDRIYFADGAFRLIKRW